MVLNKLEHGAQQAKNGIRRCFSSFVNGLFISKFLVKAVYTLHLSLTLSHFRKSSQTLLSKNTPPCPSHA